MTSVPKKIGIIGGSGALGGPDLQIVVRSQDIK